MESGTADEVGRYVVTPDPAWDWNETEDGVLVVELAWPPAALAGRGAQLVASPELISALEEAGLTGYRTDRARGFYGEGAFGVEPGDTPAALVRIVVDKDPGADLSYQDQVGLVVTGRALDVLRHHSPGLQAEAV